MRKILVLAALFVTSAMLCLTGCGSGDRQGELETIYSDTYEELQETFSDSGSKFTMVEEYVRSWAKSNDIKVLDQADSYMILKNKKTKDAKDAKSVTLHCSVDTQDMINTNHILATSLTSLLGPETHGTIKLIISDAGTNDFAGVRQIPADQLKTGNLIHLKDSEKKELKTFGSYAFDATLHKGIKREKPTHTNAYEITMNVGNYKDSFDYTNKYPDPIEVVGNYLATSKSSGYLFQLASFKSKKSDGGTPESAKAVIVIDDNNVEKMQKRFDKSFDSIKKRCEKLGIDFVYTFTETSMPKQVIDDKSSGRLISLLYTLDPGIFYQDEDTGEIISAKEFVKVSTKGDQFTLKVKGRSKTEASLTELKQALATMAGLSDVKCNVTKEYTTWSSKDDTAAYFREALGVAEDDEISTLKTSELNILAEKRPSLSCLSYGFSLAEDKDAITAITGFMSHVAGVDPE